MQCLQAELRKKQTSFRSNPQRLVAKLYKMSSPTPQKKKGKNAKDQIQLFPPPDIETLVLDENIVFDCALKNDYATICGAFDAKEHPLAAYIVEKNLLNKRNEQGKTPFDLAILAGNKEFLKAMLERSGEKLDENVWNLRAQLKPTNAYNFFHYACIWGHLDICKLLIESSKLVIDPSVELPVDSNTTVAGQTSKKDSNLAFMKTIGNVLLRTKTKTGETPKQLAKRYQHQALVDYLTFAGKHFHLAHPQTREPTTILISSVSFQRSVRRLWTI